MKASMDAVRGSQRDLEQSLELVDAKQNDMHQLLTQLEKEMERMDQNAWGPADFEREQGYVQAERINTQLNIMAGTMKELIDKLNRAQDSPTDTSSNPVAQIVQILNAHLNSLQWIDTSATQLTAKINETERLFRQAQASFKD